MMGTIMSNVRIIDDLRFSSPKKGVVHKAEFVVMLDKRNDTGPDVALVKLADGTWTVLGSRHTPNGNWAVTGYGVDQFDKNVLSALVRSGAVSAAEMAKHIKNQERCKAMLARKYAIESLQVACKTLGIPVPALADMEGE